jgi:hypothetical protein
MASGGRGNENVGSCHSSGLENLQMIIRGCGGGNCIAQSALVPFSVSQHMPIAGARPWGHILAIFGFMAALLYVSSASCL